MPVGNNRISMNETDKFNDRERGSRGLFDTETAA